MLREFTPLSEEDYLEKFDRRNLLEKIGQDPFEAAEKFREMLSEGDQVVVFGEVVRRALGLPKVLIHPVTAGGVCYRQIPHPSGLTRLYNHPTMRWLVAQTLYDLVKEDQ